MDNIELKAYMDIQFAHVNGGIDSINKHLARLNGQVTRNTDCRHEIEKDVAIIKTRLDLEGKHDDQDKERLENRMEENRKNIREIIKENGQMILTTLMLIGLIGSWVGWW